MVAKIMNAILEMLKDVKPKTLEYLALGSSMDNLKNEYLVHKYSVTFDPEDSDF